MSTATILVPGISCAACQRAIEAAVRPLPGVDSAEVDVAAKVVRVTYAEPACVDAVCAAIEAQGYDVASVQ